MHVDVDPELILSQLSENNFAPLDLNKLKLWPSDPLRRRQAPRYHLRLEIYLSNDQQIFHTRTENISFTGVLLKELIPDSFSSRIFDIVIKDLTEEGEIYYLLRGKMIPEGKFRSRRIEFQSMTFDTESKLISLFENLTAVS